jgi:carbonic anhydrase
MTFMQWWGVYWQYFAVFAGGAIWTILVIAITAARKNYVWRYTVHEHLGEITKAEITKRDDQIGQQSFELDSLRKQVKNLREKVQVMAAMSDKQIEIAGNTYRGEDE